MRANSQQQKIGGVLAVCKDYWRSSGIPENEIETMVLEAEEDLQDAMEEGKTVEEAVGPDVQEFAKFYEVDIELDSPRDRLIVGVLVAALFLIVAISIALRLDSGFSLPWYVIVVLSAAIAAILLFWTGRSR